MALPTIVSLIFSLFSGFRIQVLSMSLEQGVKVGCVKASSDNQTSLTCFLSNGVTKARNIEEDTYDIGAPMVRQQIDERARWVRRGTTPWYLVTHCLLLCACSCIVVGWIAVMKVETLLAGLMTHWHCIDCTLLLLLLLVVTLLPILILIFHIYERNMCPLVKILEEIIEWHMKIFAMLDGGFLALSIGEGGGDALGQMRGTCFAIWPLEACCGARLYFHPRTVADVPAMPSP